MVLDDAQTRPPLADRIVGLAAFATAITLLRCIPFRATLAAARAVKRFVRRSAGQVEAERALAARAWAAKFFPGRAACLEVSLAAFLAATARGRAVDWCIGCRFNPCESHAWIEADGRPLGEPELPDRPFHVVIRV